MKKLSIALLSLLLVVGCNNGNDGSSLNNTSNSSVSQSEIVNNILNKR